MNKDQFLNALEKGLKKLPSDDREEILEEFKDHFTFGLEEGKTEEEISKSLGSPQHIAKEIVATSQLEMVGEKRSFGNLLRATWAVIGLSFFNLVIVLGPFLGLVGVLIGGWVTGLGFTVSPILLLIGVVFDRVPYTWFDFFGTITLCGIGLITLIVMYYVTRFLSNLFIQYLKFNVGLVKGGMNNE